MKISLLLSILQVAIIKNIYANELTIYNEYESRRGIPDDSSVCLDVDIDNVTEMDGKKASEVLVKVVDSHQNSVCEAMIMEREKKLHCNVPSRFIKEGRNNFYITIYDPFTNDVYGRLDASFQVDFDMSSGAGVIIPTDFTVSTSSPFQMNTPINVKFLFIVFFVISSVTGVYFFLNNAPPEKIVPEPPKEDINPFDYLPSSGSPYYPKGAPPYDPSAPYKPSYLPPYNGLMPPNTISGNSQISTYGIGILAGGLGIYLAGQTFGPKTKIETNIRPRYRSNYKYIPSSYVSTPTVITPSTTLSSPPSFQSETMISPEVSYETNANTSILRAVTNVVWITIARVFEDRRR